MTTALILNWRYVESFEVLTSKNLFDINFMRQFSKPGVYLWAEQGAACNGIRPDRVRLERAALRLNYALLILNNCSSF